MTRDRVLVRPAPASVSTDAGRRTEHAFSFGAHYDPANLGFGPLVCHNDDRLQPGAGYPDHAHRDLEIVTWVLDGVLTHTDTGAGAAGAHPAVPLEAGTVQVTSAGSGIRHAEVADAASGPTRFVQMWLRPDVAGTAPLTRRSQPGLGDSHDGAGAEAGLIPIAGGPDAPPVGVADAVLHAARITAGRRIELPDAPLVHAYLARGEARIDGDVALGPGGAVRLQDAGGVGLEAASPHAELLVWSFSRR